MKQKKMQSRKGRKIGLDAMLTNHRLKKRKKKELLVTKRSWATNDTENLKQKYQQDF